MPVLGSGMHPGGFKLVPLLEDGVRDDQVKLRAYVEQAQTVAIDVAHTMLTDNVTPDRIICSVVNVKKTEVLPQASQQRISALPPFTVNNAPL